MSFILPELVVESVIRDGLANIKAKPQLLDDVFASLKRTYANRKYGQAQIDKIKALVTGTQVNVVFSYHEIDSNMPCFSIMIGSDADAKPDASMGDFRGEVFETMTSPTELAGLIKVPEILVVDWDFMNGEVELDDSIDILEAGVTQNNLITINGTSYRITAIIKTAAKQAVLIQNLDKSSVDDTADINIGDTAEIKSSLDFHKYEVNGVHSEVQIVVGVHAKDALTCKFLYILLKYFMLSRKPDLIKRDFIVSSYSGSDFSRDQAYKADRVFTRILTISGRVEDSWKQNEVDLIENVVVQVEVPQSSLDEYPQTTESLGLECQTVQISDDIESPEEP